MILLRITFLAIIALSVTSSAEVHEDAQDDLKTEETGVDYAKQLSAISILANNPAFAGLGLTPQQNLGVMTSLISSNLINPNILRQNQLVQNSTPRNVNFHPTSPIPGNSAFVNPGILNNNNGNLLQPNNNQIDPYFLLLLSHYAKYLPYGLGPQGIYGSSGLPKVKPLGVIKYNDKN